MSIKLLATETIRQILGYFEDDHVSLFRIMHVNRVWRAEGARLFWRRPYPPAIALLNSPAERQHWANGIEVLELSGPSRRDLTEPSRSGFEGLDLPRLKKVSFRNFNMFESCDPDELKVLQPSLISYSVEKGTSPPRDILQLLGMRCPNIQLVKLWLDGWSKNGLQHLLTFINGCTKLQSLELGSEDWNYMTFDIFRDLLTLPRLTELRVSTVWIETDFAQDLLQQLSEHLWKLKHIDIRSDLQTISRMLSATPHLETLGLGIWSTDIIPTLLPQIVSFNLVSLQVRFTGMVDFNFSDLSSWIQHLPTLVQLRIAHGNIFLPGFSPARGNEVLSLIEALPRLEHFEYGNAPAGSMSLHAIARACPNLVTWSMLRLRLDMRDLTYIQLPLLPKLLTLRIGSFQDFDDLNIECEAQRAARLLRYHANHFEFLHVWRFDHEFSRMVFSEVQRLDVGRYDNPDRIELMGTPHPQPLSFC
ncbi:hypothetical protein K461DRAFT_268339 [Myriangium duriaei CBS 260.36]|uniref:F-box domain-containing protein n=1 Tax=Myriangium duriaei CBS 260.36 TaxID=1168546 RepID=A0A9P4MM49_9PEZI|nr:hypothetical protein K461DRAFT_268339 [Myriangium duriaei CBS 260.36]